MQPEEMQALRQRMGLSQDQLAKALDLSRNWIGLMERGKKPIEKRTALAMLHLRDHPELR